MTTFGFGVSYHWCTEAIFQSLRGVSQGLNSLQAVIFPKAVIVISTFIQMIVAGLKTTTGN